MSGWDARYHKMAERLKMISFRAHDNKYEISSQKNTVTLLRTNYPAKSSL